MKLFNRNCLKMITGFAVIVIVAVICIFIINSFDPGAIPVFDQTAQG